MFEFDAATKVTVKTFREKIHPEDLPSIDAVFARGMAGMDVDIVFRILTSGGRQRAVSGLRALAKLTAHAGNRVIIMPGGGINERNVRRIARALAARELHCSLREHIPSPRLGHLGGFEQKVRKLSELIAAGNAGSTPAKSSPLHDFG